MLLTRLGFLLILTLGLAGAAAATVACDPTDTITIDNQTTERLFLSEDGVRAHSAMEPGKVTRFSTLRFAGAELIEIKNEDGTLFYSRRLSRHDLSQLGWRITIDASAPVSHTNAAGGSAQGIPIS